jgi:hypothetical protein
MGKKIMWTTVGIGLLLVIALPLALGQQAGLKVLSPKEGATVSESVTLRWELKKAGNADHVHLYLDGSNQGPEYGTSAELKGLSNSSHTIRLITATSGHQEIGPEATVKVTVKGTAEAPKATPTPRRGYGY